MLWEKQKEVHIYRQGRIQREKEGGEERRGEWESLCVWIGIIPIQ